MTVLSRKRIRTRAMVMSASPDVVDGEFSTQWLGYVDGFVIEPDLADVDAAYRWLRDQQDINEEQGWTMLHGFRHADNYVDLYYREETV